MRSPEMLTSEASSHTLDLFDAAKKCLHGAEAYVSDSTSHAGFTRKHRMLKTVSLELKEQASRTLQSVRESPVPQHASEGDKLQFEECKGLLVALCVAAEDAAFQLERLLNRSKSECDVRRALGFWGPIEEFGPSRPDFKNKAPLFDALLRIRYLRGNDADSLTRSLSDLHRAYDEF